MDVLSNEIQNFALKNNFKFYRYFDIREQDAVNTNAYTVALNGCSIEDGVGLLVDGKIENYGFSIASILPGYADFKIFDESLDIGKPAGVFAGIVVPEEYRTLVIHKSSSSLDADDIYCGMLNDSKLVNLDLQNELKNTKIKIAQNLTKYEMPKLIGDKLRSTVSKLPENSTFIISGSSLTLILKSEESTTLTYKKLFDILPLFIQLYE